MSQKDAGRVWVIVVIIVVLAEWPASRAFHAFSPLGGLAGSLIGPLVSVALCVFLYRGANWARLLLGLLSLLGWPALVFGWLDYLDFGLRPPGAYFIAVGLTSIFVTAVLLFVPAVRAYCRDRVGATG